jgi:hypothetical protein
MTQSQNIAFSSGRECQQIQRKGFEGHLLSTSSHQALGLKGLASAKELPR